MQIDLLIRNTTLVTDGLEMRADLGVTDGVVTHIGQLNGTEAAETLDGTGKYVLPGLVDLGVSLLGEGEFYPPSRHSVAELTSEALAGGITTMITAQSWDLRGNFTEDLARRQAEDEETASIDFGYHYFVEDWSEDRRRHLRSALGNGLSSVWIARAGLSSPLPGGTLIHAVMRELPESSYAITTPSDPLFEHYFRTDLRSGGRIGPKYYTRVFPEWIEASMLRSYDALLHEARSRLVVLGLSCPESLVELQRLRERGTRLIGGAKLPHMVLNTDMLNEETAAILPFAWPPLRGRGAQHALWSALDDGLLNMVSSAHHPRTVEEVREGQKDAMSAEGGGTGITHLLPLLHSEGVAKWRLTLESLSQCACADPAKLAGLYPRKGSLQIGSEADLVILDPSKSYRIQPAGAAVGHYDPYAGIEVSGTVEAVYLRGHRVFGNGADPAPQGRFLEGTVSLK
ncbi:amidohydrolase family protein [bacterium]|nr:amidohydrolase family protein [bacterium]